MFKRVQNINTVGTALCGGNLQLSLKLSFLGSFSAIELVGQSTAGNHQILWLNI